MPYDSRASGSKGEPESGGPWDAGRREFPRPLQRRCPVLSGAPSSPRESPSGSRAFPALGAASAPGRSGSQSLPARLPGPRPKPVIRQSAPPAAADPARVRPVRPPSPARPLRGFALPPSRTAAWARAASRRRAEGAPDALDRGLRAPGSVARAAGLCKSGLRRGALGRMDQPPRLGPYVQ